MTPGRGQSGTSARRSSYGGRWSPSRERAVDRQKIVRDDHPLLSAARVHDDEIEGYGSKCQWSHSTRRGKGA
jgi:hypothetical protein